MPPLNAAKLAADSKLRVYTIGVGAPVEDGFFGSSGNTDLDEDTLKQIAATTGGEYFRAGDAGDLRKIYAHIAQLEPAAGRDQWYRPSSEWFAWPLALALLMSVQIGRASCRERVCPYVNISVGGASVKKKDKR